MNRGIIQVKASLLIEMLQFKDAKLLDMRYSRFSGDVLELLIEHPEMPEVREDDAAQVVNPVYVKHTNKNGRILDIKRQPLK
jgi:hypothetical protein